MFFSFPSAAELQQRYYVFITSLSAASLFVPLRCFAGVPEQFSRFTSRQMLDASFSRLEAVITDHIVCKLQPQSSRAQ